MKTTGSQVIRLLLWAVLFSAFSCQNSGKKSDSQRLYQSTAFTPPGSFTEGAEGPAVDAKGILYAVNLEREGTIGRITGEGQTSVFLVLPDSSIGNGIRFTSRGRMIVADYVGHILYDIDPADSSISILAQEPRMNQPNDLAIDNRDRLYASDPDWNNNTGRIWRIDPDGSVILLEENMGTANGIEVSPDNRTLYVNETVQRKVWAYDLSDRGEISHKRLLLNFPDFGLDGMRCDQAGNLYIARYGKGSVVKVSPEGKILKEIILQGKNPSNVAFGGEDGCTVYVTVQDNGNIESFRVDVPGRAWKK